jgi:hypothetical protein
MDFQRKESVVAVTQPDALARVALAVSPDAVGRAFFSRRTSQKYSTT